MFDWGPSNDALFGALVAGLVAWATIKHQIKDARREREKEARNRRSAIAFSVQVKIAQSYGLARSLNRAIEECFQAHPSVNAEAVEPGVKVQPLVGGEIYVSDFTPDELALILETGDIGLVERLLAFQWSVRTLGGLRSEFNKARSDYSIFVADIALTGKFIDGQFASIRIPAEKRHSYEARISQLNPMVSDMIEGASDAMNTSKQLMSRVVSAFRSMGGIDIREVKFDD